MSQCWSEGELRAYLDSELPPRDMELAAAHVKECAACGALYAELESRAARVAILLEALPVVPPALELPQLARRERMRWRWAGAAMAAALLLGLFRMPKRIEKVAASPQRQPPIVQAQPAPAPPPAQTRPAVLRRKVKLKPQVQYYMALDDEPIETGIVVRVALDNGQVPADVILGPDGRARAIRLVSDDTGER
jgi:anti-sigma factor RsiW